MGERGCNLVWVSICSNRIMWFALQEVDTTTSSQTLAATENCLASIFLSAEHG